MTKINSLTFQSLQEWDLLDHDLVQDNQDLKQTIAELKRCLKHKDVQIQSLQETLEKFSREKEQSALEENAILKINTALEEKNTLLEVENKMLSVTVAFQADLAKNEIERFKLLKILKKASE